MRLIGDKLSEIYGDATFLTSDEQVLNKIINAECWGGNDFYDPFKKSIGLASGLSGIGWTLLDSLADVSDLEVEEKSISVNL